jgi:hypothetical protein
MPWPLRNVAAVLAVLSLGGCGSDGDTDSISSPSCAVGGDLTYENFGQPFFLSWCTGCHSSGLQAGSRQGAPPDLNFDDLASIRAHRARVVERAVTQRTMPPAGGPSEAQREQLGNWLACGAPGQAHAFDPAPSVPVYTPPSGECGKARTLLPESLLPRCSHATLECALACSNSDAGDEDSCREACLQKDTTSAAPVSGASINCSTCTTLQLLACGDQNGCHDAIAGALCCNDQRCPAGAADNCGDQLCAREFRAMGLCLYYAAIECLSFTSGPLSQCFAPK